jgi:hypothetical protein
LVFKKNDLDAESLERTINVVVKNEEDKVKVLKNIKF